MLEQGTEFKMEPSQQSKECREVSSSTRENVVREVQITAARYYCVSAGVAVARKIADIKCWRESEES